MGTHGLCIACDGVISSAWDDLQLAWGAVHAGVHLLSGAERGLRVIGAISLVGLKTDVLALRD